MIGGCGIISLRVLDRPELHVSSFACKYPGKYVSPLCSQTSALQSQKAVTACLKIKQLLPFGFAWQNRTANYKLWNGLWQWLSHPWARNTNKLSTLLLVEVDTFIHSCRYNVFRSTRTRDIIVKKNSDRAGTLWSPECIIIIIRQLNRSPATISSVICRDVPSLK